MLDGPKLMKSSQMSSIRTHKNKMPLVYAVLCALLVLAAILGIIEGSVHVSLGDIFDAILGRSVGTPSYNIIILSRLPRTLGCLVAGVGLAVAGAVLQTVLGNPLAAPNVIGVNSGAGLAIAICGALYPLQVSLHPFAAFIGALVAVLLVLFISQKAGASKITTVLAGVAVAAVFAAMIDAVVTLFPDSLIGYTSFRIGGLANVSMKNIIPGMCVIIWAVAVLLIMNNEIDILALGTDTAKSLGLKIKPWRIVLLALAAALAGAAVSFAGLLGFVGLIVPHIMRNFVGERSLHLIATSGLGGAVLVTICDVVTRLVFAPYEMPVGILLSCIGGPFFIWLLLRQKSRRTHD